MTKALWLTEHKYECKKFCPSSSIFLYWFVDHFFPNFTFTDDSTGLVWSKYTFSIFRCYRNQKARIHIEFSRRQHFFDRRLFSYETTRLDVISLTVLGFYFLKRKFQYQEGNSLLFGWGSVTACLTIILLLYYFISILLFITSYGQLVYIYDGVLFC